MSVWVSLQHVLQCPVQKCEKRPNIGAYIFSKFWQPKIHLDNMWNLHHPISAPQYPLLCLLLSSLRCFCLSPSSHIHNRLLTKFGEEVFSFFSSFYWDSFMNDLQMEPPLTYSHTLYALLFLGVSWQKHPLFFTL